MCGIIGYTGPKQAAKILIDGLQILEYRGYDSAGVAVLHNENLKVIKKEGKVSKLAEVLEVADSTGNCGIAHTRWATHGKPSDVNSHPHTDCNNNFAIIHNGIVENYLELKEELIKKGHKFDSETDTEVIAHLVEQLYAGDLFNAVRAVANKLEGAYAIAVVSTYEPNKIVAVRQETPLLIGLGEGEKILASDPSALVKYTKKFWRLENGEMAVITPDKAQAYITATGEKIEKQIQEIDWNIEEAQRSGFNHYMRKEIEEQPEVIENTLRGRFNDDGTISLPELDNIKDVLKDAQKIHIVACGTSYHAGIVGKYLFENLAKIPVEVDVASEYRYRNPLLAKGDVVLVISQSGETADTLAVVRLAKKLNIPVLGIVNVVNSSIAAECDAVTYLHAGPEIGVASTKAYVSQLVLLTLITLYLKDIRKVAIDTTQIVKDIPKLSKYAAELLKQENQIENIAQTMRNNANCFFIGRLLDYAVVLEGALKLKEISYIHAEAKAAGELKHGPLALVEPGTPIVTVVTQDSIRDKMHSSIMEVKARGGNIILITDKPNKAQEIANTVIAIPKVSSWLSPILSVIPQQLLSYHASVIRGINPDRPRNLAKSVTVE
ncbi:glutamine--fructose-6-phosphate transaminase (isomerizing) [Clostridium sp. 'deep sea']|uniref:glutamine--fructose-6-phosphate transaminase (isomerizing) n=1 Tax=Clostridium sp. 'deep sea' TaxID=2779445 RepID=UPI0018964BA0|nr:glutamine--fructose-6-phosphate transaminase (isomerizing) [Clostridium sp. 'deep sea']QOR37010.1 glutamine--fructose-6-phosphate transaminase (isomerizing) [Clostridium sp. 'deep sea']